MGHQIWKPVPSVLKIGKGRMVIMAYESALFLNYIPYFICDEFCREISLVHNSLL